MDIFTLDEKIILCSLISCQIGILKGDNIFIQECLRDDCNSNFYQTVLNCNELRIKEFKNLQDKIKKFM